MRREIFAGIAATVLTITLPLTGQMRTAKLVLIQALARFEVSGLRAAAARSERRAVHVSRARPNSTPAGALRANVVIHFPARAGAITFVSRADAFDYLAAHGVTEISQTVQRLEGPQLIAKLRF